MRIFDVTFSVSLNELLDKQSIGRWIEKHGHWFDVTGMNDAFKFDHIFSSPIVMVKLRQNLNLPYYLHTIHIYTIDYSTLSDLGTAVYLLASLR